MKKYLPLLIIFCACKKNSSPGNNLVLDSVVNQFAASYRIDLNEDQQADVSISLQQVPLQVSSETIYAKPLSQAVKIHQALNIELFCRDTNFLSQGWYTFTHNCPGNSSPAYIDSFNATPNLAFSELSSTMITTFAGDSAYVYSRTYSQPMPVAGAQAFDLKKGFFAHSDSGYLLMETNGKKYALLMRKMNARLIFDKKLLVQP